MAELEGVTVLAEANVHFDGKCVSHTVILPDGSRKTLGVILPSRLRFGTREPERMELVFGSCRVRLEGEQEWSSYRSGESFDIPADAAFDIEVDERMDYICHYG